MFTGWVQFQAQAKANGNGLTFSLIEFNPQVPVVNRVEIESPGPDGMKILSTIHLSSFATKAEGRTLATMVNSAILDRIVFMYGFVFENAQQIGESFYPTNSPTGGSCGTAWGSSTAIGVGRLLLEVNPTDLKSELEVPSPSSTRYYGLFRSARLSESPVEEFMHLYHLLLMFFDDEQKDVDTFIVGQDASVPQTLSPKQKKGETETIYTRLRNEFAHQRSDVDLTVTKAEMIDRLGRIVALVKCAIDSQLLKSKGK